MSSTEEMRAQIEGLKKQLEEAERAERQAKTDALRKFKRVWKFTMVPSQNKSWHHIYDHNVVVYTLKGVCTNADEYIAIGGDRERGTKGSMDYYYNRLSGKIICSTGGGHIFVPYDSFGSRRIDKELEKIASPQSWAQKTFDDIGELLVFFPEGCDVTDIVMRNPYFKWGRGE